MRENDGVDRTRTSVDRRREGTQTKATGNSNNEHHVTGPLSQYSISGNCLKKVWSVVKMDELSKNSETIPIMRTCIFWS